MVSADRMPAEFVTNSASATTPNAASGASTICESKKNRCRTKSADGAAARFRFVIQIEDGATNAKAIRLNQKYQRARRKTRSAPIIMSNPLTDPKESMRASSLGQGGPPV